MEHKPQKSPMMSDRGKESVAARRKRLGPKGYSDLMRAVRLEKKREVRRILAGK